MPRCFAAVWALALLTGCGNGEPEWILSTEPADGAVGVAPEVLVQIVFGRAIDRNSLNQDLFHLSQGDQNLYGSVSYDLKLRRAALFLLVPLQAGGTYQAVLEAGVLDFKGNRMTTPYRWSFTVGG